jgi:arylsulfatase A-like enzyme
MRGRREQPHLGRLAADGMRMNPFFSAARCWPSRASLLTCADRHTAWMGEKSDIHYTLPANRLKDLLNWDNVDTQFGYLSQVPGATEEDHELRWGDKRRRGLGGYDMDGEVYCHVDTNRIEIKDELP